MLFMFEVEHNIWDVYCVLCLKYPGNYTYWLDCAKWLSLQGEIPSSEDLPHIVDNHDLASPGEPKKLSLLEEDMLLDLTYDELMQAFRYMSSRVGKRSNQITNTIS